MSRLLLMMSLLIGHIPASWAGEVYIAVASNFAETARQLALQFEKKTGQKVRLSFGSTGKQYAQIRHGAPFQAWFAADARRPMLLEKEGRMVSGSRFTYARGRLVLWSPTPGLVDDGEKILRQGSFRHLAVANPRLAPYGLAARQALESLGLWQSLQDRLVRGENIGQTFQFVKTGNAELGLVAASQVLRDGMPVQGSYWLLPADLHEPIEQQAVLLKNQVHAREFLEFVAGEAGRAIILANGYEVP
ncbi:molybdate ABC transporter substrate-binding protein [Thiolapillus brandeum]|uniref:Molybdenum ABC transporter substrate-binding protein n=1 Tax=Thiolapillus brandeum TaxID=1076588 RepID=A0A7U6JL74_9GAMM|nr:molybdate ABC transporter substrate-binding protein [Thiolapillus brandeum]BAO45610.1 molybdenum ABC transporter substrate-binding protein [Thiolapillus brandeum]